MPDRVTIRLAAPHALRRLEGSGRSDFLALLVMAQILSAVARAGGLRLRGRPEERDELASPQAITG